MRADDETRKVKPMDDQADWVVSFVDESRKEREQFEPIWDEVERNYLVRTERDDSLSSNTRYPLGGTPTNPNQNGYADLKDPETHQEIVTIAAQIILRLFRDPGFVTTSPVGFEDVFKSKTTAKLLEYTHRLPGNFMVFVEWVLGACLRGTGLFEMYWDYVEEPRHNRRIDFDPLTGQPVTSDEIIVIPVYDDPRIKIIDPRNFFPDTGATRRELMLGAATRFRITASIARQRAEAGIYNTSKVEAAIDSRSGPEGDEDHQETDPTTGKQAKVPHESFIPLTGLRYIGETPFKSEGDPYTRREIVVLEGETVRSEVWADEFPWFDCRILPRDSSFWGISPGEIVRRSQDFVDVLKNMIADSVVRSVHAQPIVNGGASVNLAKLRRFRPNVPIVVQGDPARAVHHLTYNPPIQHAQIVQVSEKQNMREGSGAVDTLQGLGMGTKRLSATEAAGTMENATSRPELFAVVMESEYLPPPGRYALNLFRRFLQPGTDDLARRVGESAAVVDVADILPEYDVKYVGSRIEGNRGQQLAAFREMVAASSNPIITQLNPWIPFLQKFYEQLGQHELAAMVGNPQLVQMHLMLAQLANPNQGQQQGNGNNEIQNAPPSGLLPAQIAGSVSP